MGFTEVSEPWGKWWTIIIALTDVADYVPIRKSKQFDSGLSAKWGKDVSLSSASALHKTT